MQMKMSLAAATLALMGTSALAADRMFNEINVTADLTVIEDSTAAAFWNTLEADLEANLLERLADQIAEDGAKLVVDVTSFSAAEPLAPFVVENAALAARVHVIDLENNANFDSFELMVSLEGMTVTNEDGEVMVIANLPADVIYTTLVESFADNIAARVR